MKKFIYILLVMGLFLVGCSSEKSSIEYINLNEYNELLESNDDYIVVVGNIDCGACEAFKPILEEAIKSKSINIKYVEITSSWSDDDRTSLLNATKEKLDFDLKGTPTTFIVKDKVLIDSIVGYLEYGELIDVLKEHNIVE